MVRFPQAEARLLRNVFVCRRCKSKIRASNIMVLAGKITCRKCGNKALKPKRKK